MKPAKPKSETALPLRQAREQPYKHIEGLAEDQRYQAIRQLVADIRAHPDSAALAHVEACLQSAHLHATVTASPEISRLVFLFRELVADFVPGETMEQGLEPLRTLLSRHGGGKNPEVDHEAVKRWHARLAGAGDHDATSQTATKFGIATRTVRKILAE